MHTEVLTKEGIALFQHLPAFDEFYLANGTALALQIGHRVCDDLELFSSTEIQRTLLSKVNRMFAGSLIQPMITNRHELSALVNSVKVTFLWHQFPLMTALVEVGGLELLSIKEIAATMAYNIGRHGLYTDYVDLYCILNGGHASLGEIIRMAESKFGLAFSPRRFADHLLSIDDMGAPTIEFLTASVFHAGMLAFFERALGQITIS